MDRFAVLRSFLAVVDAGSFSGAAQRLSLSKSMVSRQVAWLEADLGVRLLQRTTRRLAPTEAGLSYAERCRAVLADLAEADLAIGHLQAVPRGRLRVSAPMSFGVQHLAPHLPRFLATYPELELDLSMSDRMVDLVDEGFDAAVRIGRLADSSLVARRLSPILRVVCASPDYLARRGRPTRLEDLVAHDCLSHLEIGPTEWRFVTAGGRMVNLPVGGRFRANSGDALRGMALAGAGLAYLPTFFVGPDLRAGSLVAVLEPFVPQDTALHVVYPHNRHLSPKVRALVDFLAGVFGPRPYWDGGEG